MGEGGKRHYVLMKDFNTFMCDYAAHRGRKKIGGEMAPLVLFFVYVFC